MSKELLAWAVIGECHYNPPISMYDEVNVTTWFPEVCTKEWCSKGEK